MTTSKPIRHFQTMNEAVDFICNTLEIGACEKLWSQIEQIEGHVARDPSYPKYFYTYIFCQMQELHQKLDFRRLYDGKSFPKDGKTAKLGGHMQELGCIHIDFLKYEKGWLLHDIWICR